MFSLKSPHRGDSNEYTQHAIINIKKKIKLNYPKYNNVCSYGIFPLGIKNEFEIVVVNEPSVFEPLTFYCTLPLAFELNTFRNLRFILHVTVSNQFLQQLSLDFFSNMEICSDIMKMRMKNSEAEKIFLANLHGLELSHFLTYAHIQWFGSSYMYVGNQLL